MGMNSKIAWTDHTVNIWAGCSKVSDGCANCYAERDNNRFKMGEWGPNGKRYITKNWEKTLRSIDRKANSEGKVAKVFINSWSDFFEYHKDIDTVRQRAIEVFFELTNTFVILLTKRPENIVPMMFQSDCNFIPSCIWIGATIEHAKYINRLNHLRDVSDYTDNIFLSCEPLLSPIHFGVISDWYEFVKWVIVGGESGFSARECKPEWVNSIYHQCLNNNVPFFFKQWSSSTIIDGNLQEKTNYLIKNRQFPEGLQ